MVIAKLRSGPVVQRWAQALILSRCRRKKHVSCTKTHENGIFDSFKNFNKSFSGAFLLANQQFEVQSKNPRRRGRTIDLPIHIENIVDVSVTLVHEL